MREKYMKAAVGGLLTEALKQQSAKKMTKFNPKLLLNLERVNDGYVRFSHVVKAFVDKVEPGMKKDLDSPLAEFLVALQCEGSKNVMTGPTQVAVFAEMALKKMKDSNLLPPYREHYRDQLKKIAREVVNMKLEGAITAYFASSLLNEFSDMYFSPQGVIALNRIQMDGESLSAAYADDGRAASRERKSIAKRSEIFKRIEKVIDTRRVGLAEGIDLDDMVKVANQKVGTSHDLTGRRAILKDTQWFESQLSLNVEGDCAIARSLEKLSELGRPEFNAFPADKVQRLLTGQSEAGFERDEQRRLLHEIKRFTETDMAKASGDPGENRKALAHAQKMFSSLERNFQGKEDRSEPEKEI